MTQPSFVLIGGGARSGKSSFALERARTLGERRVFLATAEAFDAEMGERIEQHRATRGGDFRTLEEPLEVPRVLAQLRDADVVVVDCLTLWISNLLLRGDDQAAILAHVDTLLDTIAQASFRVVLVSNEVGMGIVPEHALARTFRDVTGLAHQRLARAADEIHVAILGVVLRLRPEPVQVQPR